MFFFSFPPFCFVALLRVYIRLPVAVPSRVNIVFTFFRCAFFASLSRNRRRLVGNILLCFQPADRLATTSSSEALHARRHDERVIDRRITDIAYTTLLLLAAILPTILSHEHFFAGGGKSKITSFLLNSNPFSITREIDPEKVSCLSVKALILHPFKLK